jgi:hypothetical protein
MMQEDLALKKGIDGLPYPQYYNAGIADYEGVQGESGATYAIIKNASPIAMKLADSGIILPADMRGVTKTPLYNYDSTSVAAATLITTTGFDFISQKILAGTISTSAATTYYIQESTNQTEWFTTSKVVLTANVTETIGATAYYNATSVNFTPSLRYVRVLFVVGGTALTKLSIHLFSNTL